MSSRLGTRGVKGSWAHKVVRMGPKAVASKETPIDSGEVHRL